MRGPFIGRTLGRRSAIGQFARVVDDQVAAAATREQAELDVGKSALAAAEAAARDAAQRLQEARERVAEAARAYHGETGRGRVLRFVRDRVANGDYARHLNFVATARRA